MKKIVFSLLIFIALFIIIIQFFQPPRNDQSITGDDFFMQYQEAPAYVIEILNKSCYDCHSDQTKYPWYSRVAPVSWLLNKHVIQGKEELSFSKWGSLTIRKKLSAFNEICEVITDESMPMSSYLKLHKDAVISDHDREMICKWIEAESEKLFLE